MAICMTSFRPVVWGLLFSKEFLAHMYRLNRLTGLNITVYHNFHDEVNHYRTHIWRCQVSERDEGRRRRTSTKGGGGAVLGLTERD